MGDGQALCITKSYAAMSSPTPAINCASERMPTIRGATGLQRRLDMGFTRAAAQRGVSPVVPQWEDVWEQYPIDHGLADMHTAGQTNSHHPQGGSMFP